MLAKANFQLSNGYGFTEATALSATTRGGSTISTSTTSAGSGEATMLAVTIAEDGGIATSTAVVESGETTTLTATAGRGGDVTSSASAGSADANNERGSSGSDARSTYIIVSSSEIGE